MRVIPCVDLSKRHCIQRRIYTCATCGQRYSCYRLECSGKDPSRVHGKFMCENCISNLHLKRRSVRSIILFSKLYIIRHYSSRYCCCKISRPTAVISTVYYVYLDINTRVFRNNIVMLIYVYTLSLIAIGYEESNAIIQSRIGATI